MTTLITNLTLFLTAILLIDQLSAQISAIKYTSIDFVGIGGGSGNSQAGIVRNNITNKFIPRSLVYTFNHQLQAASALDPTIQGQQSGLRYYHILTPLQKSDNTFYRFDLQGYAYGASQPLDITWCGYNSPNGNLYNPVNLNRNKDQSITQITQYYYKNSLVLKFGPINRYHNAFSLYYQGHANYGTLQSLKLGINGAYDIVVSSLAKNLGE